MRTSKASLYLPIEKGGLNIPNIELFSKLITIKTIQYQGHSNNCLVKKAVVQSLQNCKKCKTKNLNYWENVWDICNENNLKIIFGRSDHRFKTPKAHKKEREIAIWTDGSRSKEGTGIGILIQSSNATTCHKYKLDPRYTHNMAELSAVVTSLKLIPSSSSVTITTDSEIAQKIFTNNNYRGQFIQLKREYEATIQDKKLKVTIEWVKGHDKCQENNFVDKLAKNASTKGKFLDPKNLFTQEQLLIIKDSLWIPNPCRIIRNNWLSQISENSQVTNLVSDTTFRYIEGKSTPHHKYSIWRNLNFCHVRSFKQHICPECNVPLSHEHLILQCPLLQFQRKWAIDNIKKHTNRDPILVSTESDHLNNYKFYLNYKGILQHNTTMDSISLFHREWFNIQSTLSLLAGHAHTQYWKIVQ
ncbi:hypothetical protein C9374_014533 [Naegleria lovaniensis]|uniref:ribonuclease H n=1 Tax=Naegleria lovaniensis TaxID=51637 RepID=A0AA88GZ93_NAELO|nr:uncharacterized protein C9374_014533 [Naegleria lovaniensis]KAG2389133.1 hypothetical protein C9374_014533 [Naegleria lovaniensis]